MKETFDPGELEPADAYKLLIGLVVPRAIGWIGTMNRAGMRNLAPFSFFTAVAATPPSVAFTTIRPSGASKDSLRNVQETGEFTVSTVTEELVEQMNASSATVDHGIDEFDLAGLKVATGVRVSAPYVSEAKAAMECRLVETVDVGEPPMAGTIVIGEVLCFHIDENLVDGTRIDQSMLRAVGRMGGPLYTRTRDLFGMERPG